MRVSFKQPTLPTPVIDKKKFYSDYKRIFGKMQQNEVDNIWQIIQVAITQRHGTMLVITENVQQEAKRLSKQGFLIQQKRIDEVLVDNLTRIDGAVLLSPEGVVFSIGVILDGFASEKGDTSRGSRYNSAVRYYETNKDKFKCLIVVVSMDGMINIIPDLIPQFDKKQIIDNIKKLEEINCQSTIKIKDFNNTMHWFENNNFYLNQEHCDKINNIRKEIDEKIKKVSTKEGLIQIIYYDFKPNPEMNETYYITN